MTGLLPKGFEALEPYALIWAGGNAAERAHLRGNHPAADLRAFHAACSPLLRPALALLDQKPLESLEDIERRLLNILLTYAHVSLAVDVQGKDEEKHRTLREAMRITRSLEDQTGAA